MTLNGVIAVVLLYFTEFVSYGANYVVVETFNSDTYILCAIKL